MVKYKDFRIGDLFLVKSNPQLNKDSFEFEPDGEYPYFTRTVLNNGIAGYVKYLDDEHMINGNSIAVGMLAMKFFYMRKNFYAGQFTKTIFPKFNTFNEKIALYFLTLFNNRNGYYKSVLVRDFEKTFLEDVITLPVNENDEIDYIYMESRIRELEEERVRELEKYLIASNLNTCQISQSEQALLTKQVRFKEFVIEELFEKIKTNTLKFKAADLKNYTKSENNIPVLTAGIENQGLAYYAPKQNATILKNVISVSANGANTGAMFYQPNEFSVLQDSYAIRYKSKELTKNQYLYFVTLLQKVIRNNYSWTNKAGWERIKKVKFVVPINSNNQIYYEYMEQYIKVQKKLAIQDVVKYKDLVINKTKSVINN